MTGIRPAQFAPPAAQGAPARLSLWGKIGGASLGLVVGGPLGALLGALAGHFLIDREGALFATPPRDVILATGLVALSAKMAKADGVVLAVEVAAFHKVVIVPAEETDKVARLFQLAQATTAGFEAYARQLAEAFADEPALLDDVIDGLFLIAQADEALHEAEIAFLRRVADIFGRDEAWFETVLARHVREGGDPYRALGAERAWTDEALKTRYRALVREWHPDRQIARGLPPEAIAIATERLAAINAAWDRIALERRL